MNTEYYAFIGVIAVGILLIVLGFGIVYPWMVESRAEAKLKKVS
jgi:hypothetical protein